MIRESPWRCDLVINPNNPISNYNVFGHTLGVRGDWVHLVSATIIKYHDDVITIDAPNEAVFEFEVTNNPSSKC